MSARISSGSDLTVTLQAVADGVVEVVGFGLAVVNHRLASGDFTVVAIAGPDDLNDALMGAVSPRDDMDRAMASADHWGSLRFIPESRSDETAAAQWVPQRAVVDAPGAWRPRDMLLAPMWGDDGTLIGVLSVDQPPGGVKPTQQVCELLEIFASHAGIAIAAVELRERYLAERTSREERLIDQAHRDPLTGLANRRVLEARLVRSTEVAARTGRTGALLFCDVDRLKHFNDERGHAAGDAVLLACAEAISDHVRDGDLVARIGGDEFVVVADAITGRAAEQLADRLRSIVVSTAEGEIAGVGLSVGVATFDGDSATARLIAEADTAMYRDKLTRR